MNSEILFIYRLCAIVAGVGWMICLLASFTPGRQVFDFLNFASQHDFEYHVMLDYWMKMAGIAFAFIGAGFLFVGMKWKKNLSIGRYFALFQVLSGIGVLLSMVRLDLDTRMYVLDCLFFFGTGIPMLWTWTMLKATRGD